MNFRHFRSRIILLQKKKVLCLNDTIVYKRKYFMQFISLIWSVTLLYLKIYVHYVRRRERISVFILFYVTNLRHWHRKLFRQSHSWRLFKVFLNRMVNARRSVHSTRFHLFIVTRNSNGRWRHRHTGMNLFDAAHRSEI